MNFRIEKVDRSKEEEIQNVIDFKTKPLGSLGKLERIAKKICLIQGTEKPALSKPVILVVAGDHGIAKEGVSPFPQEVTYQMVMNFLNGGAGINVFARQNDIELKIIDTGVNYDFENIKGLINNKVNYGTKSFLEDEAMTDDECRKAINYGAEAVEECFENGSNIIGFGEMGIGNTSPASMILHKAYNIPIEKTVGKGSGLNDEGLKRKLEILAKASEKHKVTDPFGILKTYGGFEIAFVTGAMLKAAELKMIIMVDGFIITSALIIASLLEPNVLDYCLFSHSSEEPGHKLMLEKLNGEPILHLNLRLGEGTGAALAYPVIKSAVAFINEMATFESANVSNKNE